MVHYVTVNKFTKSKITRNFILQNQLSCVKKVGAFQLRLLDVVLVVYR